MLHRIYVVHKAALLRQLRIHVGVGEAEAVVHELFVELLKNRELRRRFKGGRMFPWLREIGRLKALEHRRRAGREAPHELPDIGVSPQRRMEARDLLTRFLADSVPCSQQLFFGLRFVERRTQVEIAARIGVPRSTLEGWEHNLIRKLRAFVMER